MPLAVLNVVVSVTLFLIALQICYTSVPENLCGNSTKSTNFCQIIHEKKVLMASWPIPVIDVASCDVGRRN